MAADVFPMLQQDVGQLGLPVTVRVEGDMVFIDHSPLASGTGYVPSTGTLKSGA